MEGRQKQKPIYAITAFFSIYYLEPIIMSFCLLVGAAGIHYLILVIPKGSKMNLKHLQTEILLFCLIKLINYAKLARCLLYIISVFAAASPC